MPLSHEIDFGLHDAEAAKTIHATNKYDSWTITVSFYSSLHFVRGKIFPITETAKDKKIHIKSFEMYCWVHQADDSSKHSKLQRLVEQHLPAISVQFKWLFDQSITARYRNYHFDPSYAVKALEHLELIRVACT